MKSTDKKKRAVKIISGGSLALAVAVLLWWGNTAVSSTYIDIFGERIPSGLDGFTIAHVSDLHNAEFGKSNEKLLSQLKAASPDIIAVTGDLIDSRRHDIPKAMEFIDSAVDIAPIYYVSGNNEAWSGQYDELKERLLEAGVTVLESESTTIEHEGVSLRLLGLSDPDFLLRYDKRSLVGSQLNDMVDGSGNYCILLSHRPELFDIYAEHNIDLVLSGHAHGGQLRIPFVGGLAAPNQGLFPEYTEGLHKMNNTQMIISRGLGNSVFPLRVNNRPELIVATLRS